MIESQKRLSKIKATKETKKEEDAINLGISRRRAFQKEGQYLSRCVPHECQNSEKASEAVGRQLMGT